MTPGESAEELQTVASSLATAAERGKDPKVVVPTDAYEAAADRIRTAWSGSNLGYHTNVYYEGFHPPPSGAIWDAEWGGLPAYFQGTRGNWVEYDRSDIHKAIDKFAGDADLRGAEHAASQAKEVFDAAHSTVLSVLTALGRPDDEYLRAIRAKVEGLEIPGWRHIASMRMVATTVVSRDMRALNGGRQSSAHEDVIARVLAIRTAFAMCAELGKMAGRAASHLERGMSGTRGGDKQSGDRVAIGHGRSQLWRELKDFIQDRMLLPWDEFNRVPVAGVTNVARLAEMMDGAGIAFLILTAEDERRDGTIVARENVVHEAGLFQGRLGFTRAIIMLEDGCDEFSNIQGLGQIRFPAGNISTAFEEVRQVLEREGFAEP